MSDDQLGRVFQVVNEPVDPDPAFRESLFALLSARVADDIAPGEALPASRDIDARGVVARQARRTRHPWRLLLVAALLGVIAAGAIVAGSILTHDDLWSRLRSGRVVRIAMRPDFPQTAVSGLAGFDVDVAAELARRLGLTEQPLPVGIGRMLLGGSSTWDVAMPSEVLTAKRAIDYVASRPYYRWDDWLLTGVDAPAGVPADLSGQRICAVAGSASADWLTGVARPGTIDVVAPPTSITLRLEGSDRACIDALTAGEVDALVTSALSAADLATRPSLRAVGGPVFSEARAVIASRDGPDPGRLIAEVDAAIAAMSADGTLADLSRNRFGGRDLSIPAVP